MRLFPHRIRINALTRIPRLLLQSGEKAGPLHWQLSARAYRFGAALDLITQTAHAEIGAFLGAMPRIYKTTIRALALAAATLTLSIQTVSAKPKAKPQALWVGGNLSISVFQGPVLETGGDVSPNLSFAPKNYGIPVSMAFDRHENLWLTNLSDLPGAFAVFEISRADVASLKRGKPAKRKVIRPSGAGVVSSGWLGLDFDAAANLWLTSSGKQLLKLPSSELHRDHPGPSVVISTMAWFPGAIRFDSSNNLWMGPSGARLWKFAPADQAASGPPNASLELDLPGGLVPIGFAFDDAGNLWIAGPIPTGMGAFADEIVMISARDLNGSGEISPSAAVTITSSTLGTTTGFGTCVGGIDFDHSGDLWVDVVGTDAGTSCNAVAQVVEFTPAQLGTGGSLEPSVSIGETGSENAIFDGPIRFGRTVK